jgi:enoyl-CoA hydratase
MTTDELLGWERKDRVGIITLKRSEARNALDWSLLRRLDAALLACGEDRELRAVIITGGADFCAGADLREMGRMSVDEAGEFSRLGHAVFRRIEDLPQVVVAAVSGYALGGGCELALACDIRLAGESARFGLPEVNLGLIPGFGGTQRLAALVGHGRAREMILTGRVIDGREAEAMGLASGVAGDRELPARAEELAARLARKSPVALGTAKQLLVESMRRVQGLALETAAFTDCFDSRDRKEGIAAFLEKRHPVF